MTVQQQRLPGTAHLPPQWSVKIVFRPVTVALPTSKTVMWEWRQLVRIISIFTLPCPRLFPTVHSVPTWPSLPEPHKAITTTTSSKVLLGLPISLSLVVLVCLPACHRGPAVWAILDGDEDVTDVLFSGPQTLPHYRQPISAQPASSLTSLKKTPIPVHRHPPIRPLRPPPPPLNHADHVTGQQSKVITPIAFLTYTGPGSFI